MRKAAALIIMIIAAQDTPAGVAVSDAEAYSVYAIVLAREKEHVVQLTKDPNVALQRETETFPQRGSNPLPGCKPDGTILGESWQPVVESYEKENAPARFLVPGQLPLAEFNLMPKSALRPTGYPAYLQVSAVGFNPARTRAIVYVAHRCGGKCGGGSHHLLEKLDGAWREVNAGAPTCRWIS